MKKIYSAQEVLIAVIAYYANNDCDDFDATVSAQFIGDETEVELTIEANENGDSVKTIDDLVNKFDLN